MKLINRKQCTSWFVTMTSMVPHLSYVAQWHSLFTLLFCHFVMIYFNAHWQLVCLLRDGSLYCFCLLAESYETINQSISHLKTGIYVVNCIICNQQYVDQTVNKFSGRQSAGLLDQTRASQTMGRDPNGVAKCTFGDAKQMGLTNQIWKFL